MIIINRNLMIGIAVIIVLVGGGWFLLKDKMAPSPKVQTTKEIAAPSDSTVQSSPAAVESTNPAMTGAVKEFTITGSNFKFDTPEIKVKQGDTVKIKFKNAQGFHDFMIDEFNVKAKQQQGPSEELLTFVADKTGTFEYYCSVGQHRAMGMKGTLIVE